MSLPILYNHCVGDDSLMSHNDLLFQPSSAEIETWGEPGAQRDTALIHSDSIVVLLLLGLVGIMLLWRLVRPLWQQLSSNFLYSTQGREDVTIEERRENIRLLTTLLYCAEGAILTYAIIHHFLLENIEATSWILLLSYAAVILLYLVIKKGLYHWVHSVFFSKAQQNTWRNDFTFLFMLETVFAFPFLLILTYLHVEIQTVLWIGLFMLFFIKIVLLFKNYSTFFKKKHGILHLFVYFCTLEGTPLIILWALLVEITLCLTLR